MKKRRNLRTRGRFKAVFGWDDAIQAGATLAAASINAAATNAAAKEQSNAMLKNAAQQAQAITEQTNNAEKLEEKSIESQKQNFNQMTETMNTANMNLAMLAGQDSAQQRREEALIQVKYGGRPMRRSLRHRGQKTQYFPLQGDVSQSFRVTDGGYVIPRGVSPDGYALYEFRGNDHDHYHKTKDGYKSGVGVKFFDDVVMELEGNQNEDIGEALAININNPQDRVALTKHNLKIPNGSINPTEEVFSGAPVRPVEALQEGSKAIYGIPNQRRTIRGKGKYGCRVKAVWGLDIDPEFEKWLNENNYPMPVTYALGYGRAPRGDSKTGMYSSSLSVLPYADYQKTNNYNYDDVNVARMFPTQSHMDFNYNSDNVFKPLGGSQNLSPVKIGGEGNNFNAWSNNGMPSLDTKELIKRKPNTVNPVKGQTQQSFYDSIPDIKENGSSFWKSPYLGAAINAAGQLGAATIGTLASMFATNKAIKAENRAAEIIREAYNKRHYIDEDQFSLNRFSNPELLVAQRSFRVNKNPELADADRQERRISRAYNDNTLSSAARNSRLLGIYERMQEGRSKIYADKANREEEIKQRNIEQLNQAGIAFMQEKGKRLDIQSRLALEAAKFNATQDIDAIRELADYEAQAVRNIGGYKANLYNQVGNNYGNAVVNSTGTFNNAYNSLYRSNLERDYVLGGADVSSQMLYALNGSDLNFAKQIYNRLKARPTAINNTYAAELEKVYGKTNLS